MFREKWDTRSSPTVSTVERCVTPSVDVERRTPTTTKTERLGFRSEDLSTSDDDDEDEDGSDNDTESDDNNNNNNNNEEGDEENGENTVRPEDGPRTARRKKT